MMQKDDVKNTLKPHITELTEHFNLATLSLFGSVARGETGPDSDVDLLVEFSEPVGLFLFIELQLRLEEILGCKVDLGTPRSLKLHLKDTVLQEAIRIV